jgi:hypothetical protein
VKLAADAGLPLRQNYNREAPKLAGKIARYAHAKQYKRVRSHLKKLKTLVGGVWRDVSRQLAQVPAHLKPKVADLLHKYRRQKHLWRSRLTASLASFAVKPRFYHGFHISRKYWLSSTRLWCNYL